MRKTYLITALYLFFLPTAISFADLATSTPSPETETIQEKTQINIENNTESKNEAIQKPIKKSEKTLVPVISDEIKKQNNDFSDEKFKEFTSLETKRGLETLEGADLTFSFTVTILSDKSLKTPIILQPFVIEPDGHLHEFGKYTDQIEEGLNTRFIKTPTLIDNPIKGNYVVGYLASFKDPVEATVTFSGVVKGALSRPVKDNGEMARKINIFVTEQPALRGPSGREIISVSSDLEIF